MLFARLLGQARTQAYLPQATQESLPFVLAGTSVVHTFLTVCAVPLISLYSFAPHLQRSVTRLVRKRHSLALWQRSCYEATEWLFMRRSEHVKTKRLGLKLSRLRFDRFGTEPSGHFIGKFGPASRRRSTAHPFLLYRLALFYHLQPFIRESVLCRHPALWKSYFPQSKPLVTRCQTAIAVETENLPLLCQSVFHVSGLS